MEETARRSQAQRAARMLCNRFKTAEAGPSGVANAATATTTITSTDTLTPAALDVPELFHSSEACQHIFSHMCIAATMIGGGVREATSTAVLSTACCTLTPIGTTATSTGAVSLPELLVALYAIFDASGDVGKHGAACEYVLRMDLIQPLLRLSALCILGDEVGLHGLSYTITQAAPSLKGLEWVQLSLSSRGTAFVDDMNSLAEAAMGILANLSLAPPMLQPLLDAGVISLAISWLHTCSHVDYGPRHSVTNARVYAILILSNICSHAEGYAAVMRNPCFVDGLAKYVRHATRGMAEANATESSIARLFDAVCSGHGTRIPTLAQVQPLIMPVKWTLDVMVAMPAHLTNDDSVLSLLHAVESMCVANEDKRAATETYETRRLVLESGIAAHVMNLGMRYLGQSVLSTAAVDCCTRALNVLGQLSQQQLPQSCTDWDGAFCDGDCADGAPRRLVDVNPGVLMSLLLGVMSNYALRKLHRTAMWTLSNVLCDNPLLAMDARVTHAIDQALHDTHVDNGAAVEAAWCVNNLLAMEDAVAGTHGDVTQRELLAAVHKRTPRLFASYTELLTSRHVANYDMRMDMLSAIDDALMPPSAAPECVQHILLAGLESLSFVLSDRVPAHGKQKREVSALVHRMLRTYARDIEALNECYAEDTCGDYDDKDEEEARATTTAAATATVSEAGDGASGMFGMLANARMHEQWRAQCDDDDDETWL